MKVRLLIAGIALFGALTSALFSQNKAEMSADDQKKIVSLADTFFGALKRGASAEITALLHPDVQIKSIAAQDLKKMIDDLLEAKISAVDYIMKTTGNNISYFTGANTQKAYAVISYTVGSEISLDEIEMKDSDSIPVYFLQVNMSYQDAAKAAPAGAAKKSKRAEVEIVSFKGGYRIIGFIF
ncbi:MAG: hypothetical protein AABZ39_00345 [Spirochaetota bacterium]